MHPWPFGLGQTSVLTNENDRNHLFWHGRSHRSTACMLFVNWKVLISIIFISHVHICGAPGGQAGVTNLYHQSYWCCSLNSVKHCLIMLMAWKMCKKLNNQFVWPPSNQLQDISQLIGLYVHFKCPNFANIISGWIFLDIIFCIFILQKWSLIWS